MRDLQARNRDPYGSSSSSSDSDSAAWQRGGALEANASGATGAGGEYEEVMARREAAVVLDSAELLMMFAQARGEVSIFYLYPYALFFTNERLSYRP
jgi:hypothetical protein